MGKRDVAYMQGQREMITRVAWDCMLEKGLARTSIRDICVRAGVSVGALYNHFKDKGEIVSAVLVLDYDGDLTPPAPPTTWAGYADRFREVPESLKDPRNVHRLRLAHEFLAEIIQLGRCPEGYEVLVEAGHRYHRDPLAAMHAAGEITLPLGLETTTDLHTDLYTGMCVALMQNPSRDPAEKIEDLIEGLALLSGLKA